MKEKVVVAIIIFGAAALLMGSSCRRLSAAHLMSAACDGDIKKATNLLELGVDVNATDGMSNSALTLAEGCKRDDTPTRVQLVELLIAKRAEVNHRSFCFTRAWFGTLLCAGVEPALTNKQNDKTDARPTSRASMLNR